MRPLADVRVLDLSRLLPGPFATLVLADLGASVDKIEDAGGGDYLRAMPPQVAGESVAFQLLNRGKRSAVLDLKKPEGKAAFLRLLGSYDVLFEQFRPGVLDRLGLGHAALRAAHPRLIICALTGYGQTGPSPTAPATISTTSLAAASSAPTAPPTAPPGPGLPARRRQRRHVERDRHSSRLDGARPHRPGRRDRHRHDRRRPRLRRDRDGQRLRRSPQTRGAETLTGGIAPYNTYTSRDGHPMTLAALEPKFWMSFCAGTGLEGTLEALIPGPTSPLCARKSPPSSPPKPAKSGSPSPRSTTVASSPSSPLKSSPATRTSPRATSSSTYLRTAATSSTPFAGDPQRHLLHAPAPLGRAHESHLRGCWAVRRRDRRADQIRRRALKRKSARPGHMLSM